MVKFFPLLWCVRGATAAADKHSCAALPPAGPIVIDTELSFCAIATSVAKHGA